MKVLILSLALVGSAFACTETQVSGRLAPAPGTFCSGDIIFEDNFNTVDRSKWFFENTLAGGGNWEFQWYPGYDPMNCFVRDSVLHFKPTLTSDLFGEDFLTSGRVTIPPEECTQADWNGCDRQGSPNNVINPIRSTKMDTRETFAFVYGELEIRAKSPAGDWLWPALWMLPYNWTYGGWPLSGEIDLMEIRGNRNLYSSPSRTLNVGVEQTGATMHFGPQWDVNGWPTAHHTHNLLPGVGFDKNFHTYRLRWTKEGIYFYVDNHFMGSVLAGDGFWYRDPQFANSGLPNPWIGGTKMAPFDQPFYIILNLAVGGINYFSDSFFNYPGGKPWLNTSPQASTDFWNGRGQWLPTWTGEDTHFEIDYVRVRAL